MNLDPLRILSFRMRFKSAVLLPFLAAYIVLTFVIFFKAVRPSYETDTTSWSFAVDSTQYVYMADSLREGRNEPWVLASFAKFPNTVLTPVLIALVFNSAFWVMIFDFAVLAISICILKRAFPISPVALICLLLLNPTTTTSILCVNKEILDLFGLSLFLYSRKTGNRALLFLALVLAFLNRYEICVVMLGYLLVQSRLNPWREKRWLTLLLVVGGLSFLMPIFGSHELAGRFEEAQFAGIIKVLDTMQINYLYFVAVIPKIADNIFGFLLNRIVWQAPSSWLYIMYFNNLSYALLLIAVAAKRQLRLGNDLIYLGAIGSVLVAQSLVVQPRYFYFLYVLLCLQAAHKGRRGPAIGLPLSPKLEVEHS